MDVFKEVVCRDGQNDKNISQLSKFLRYVSEYTYLLTIFYLHLKKYLIHLQKWIYLHF